MGWIRLAAVIAIFVLSCAGTGYLAASRLRGSKRPGLFNFLVWLAVSIFWAALFVGFVFYDLHYHRPDPEIERDPEKTAMSAIIFVTPFIFLIGFLITSLGTLIANLRYSKANHR